MRHFPDSRCDAAIAGEPEEMVGSGLCIGCGGCAAGAMRVGPRRLPQAAMSSTAAARAILERSAHSRRAPRTRTRSQPSASRTRRHDAGSAASKPPMSATSRTRFGRERKLGRADQLGRRRAAAQRAVDGVAHVAPADPARRAACSPTAFRARSTSSSAGAKSRYYPVELSQVLREIRATPGRYAIVGVPCFIKAIHLLRRVDPLIARARHAHPRPVLRPHEKRGDGRKLRLAARRRDEAGPGARLPHQGRKPTGQLVSRAPRARGRQQPPSRTGGISPTATGARAFSKIPPATGATTWLRKRPTSAFGDAWVEPYSSDGRGTNVVVVRSKEMPALVERARADGRLSSSPVDAEFIVRTQAAGLRHRRDGLAYRLTWPGARHPPRKRVAPSADLPLRRKLVYRLRYSIARWSHPMLRLARKLHCRRSTRAGRGASCGFYQSVTWSRGRLGRAARPADAAAGALGETAARRPCARHNPPLNAQPAWACSSVVEHVLTSQGSQVQSLPRPPFFP